MQHRHQKQSSRTTLLDRNERYPYLRDRKCDEYSRMYTLKLSMHGQYQIIDLLLDSFQLIKGIQCLRRHDCWMISVNNNTTCSRSFNHSTSKI